VRRIGAAIIAALLVVGLCVPAAFAAAPTATTAAVPRVVFIVGPSGAATNGYRSQARAAAAIARRYTPDVIEIYSPNATWTAVKQATTGASLVVYMGHGNGWPSRYRDALFPATQNGFGLNPTAGGSDSIHQYFGEAAVGSQLKFAKNAVVLLNHLCYASGLSEPGLPEGTLDQAQQRVDNYAAGFIRAGASAVIADAWASPSYFVRAILGGGRSIQTAWLESPTAHDNRLAFESQRSPGYVAQMDPETATSGFTRSIVMKTGLAPADVLAGARGSAFAAGFSGSLAPTLNGTGIKLAVPDFAAVPTAGTRTNIDVPFTIKDRKALPKGLQASVRWDPIAVSTVPTQPATASAGTDPAAPMGPDATAPTTIPTPAPSPDATPSAAPISGLLDKEWIEPPADDIDLVIPERIGDVVSPVAVKVGKTSLQVPVDLPSAPGRYRLTITLHDSDGVAYDAASQALLPSLLVRITGDFDGAIQAAPTVELTAGREALLGLRVVNLGKTPWGHEATENPAGLARKASVAAEAATVVGRWIPLSAGAKLPLDEARHSATTKLPFGLEPGVSLDAVLGLTAPDVAGDYLLVLDVVTPERGSLIASGAEPTLVRVTVVVAP